MRIAALFGLLLMGSAVYAQVPDTTEAAVLRDLEMILEEVDEDSGIDAEQITQFLQDLAANPLDLNTVSVEELMQIPGVTLRVASAVVAHRKKNGKFASVSELEKVKGVGAATRARMQPYVTVRATRQEVAFDSRRMMRNAQTEVIVRYRTILEDQEGFTRPDSVTSRYLGTQSQQYQRLTFTSDQISFNLTQDMDPGEPGNVAQPDFRSMHLALQKTGMLQTLVVGDFTAGFGQGVLMFSGGAARKGREVIGAGNRSERGIRPYRSAEENRFFRGIGFEYGDRVILSGFYSSRKWSASPAGDTAFFFPNFTGLNRTPAERARSNNLGIDVAGSRLRFKSDRFRGGVSGYYARFSNPIVPRSGVQNLYDFAGSEHYAGSADFRLLLDDVQFFGEAAIGKEGAPAVYGGTEWYAGDATTLTVIYRDYSEKYVTLFGDAFSEGSGIPQNEQGIYLGLKHQINRKLTASVYADQYRFPAPRFSIARPSSGTDLLGTLDIVNRGSWSAYILVRSESQETQATKTDNSGRTISVFGYQTRRSVRINGDFPVNRQLRWRSRIELAYFNMPEKNATRGVLVFQDFRYAPTTRLQFDARVSFFDTQSFDARVYQFENDLLFVMSNAALSGRGRRFYLLTKWTPKPRLEVWAKYDVTIYDDRDQIGSGLDLIQGNVRSRFGIQTRWRF